jgi:hypothetical protein
MSKFNLKVGRLNPFAIFRNIDTDEPDSLVKKLTRQVRSEVRPAGVFWVITNLIEKHRERASRNAPSDISTSKD